MVEGLLVSLSSSLLFVHKASNTYFPSSSSSSSSSHKQIFYLPKHLQLKLKSPLPLVVIAQSSSSSLHQHQHHQQQQQDEDEDEDEDDMKSSSCFVSKVAVVGSGISGCVCASSLARSGISVTLFESGRGPGGRTSQRREISQDDDGKEFSFDHGAPYFTVTNNTVMDQLVRQWQAKGFLAEWREKFGYFDFPAAKFVDFDPKEGSNNKYYVGIPGMNSICKALCHEPGVDAKFGVTVGGIKWLEDKNLWLLTDLDGKILGHFDGVVAADKNIVSSRSLVGRQPPLDISLSPELAVKLQEVPVVSCFALMLAFPEPLSTIPVRGILFQNSEVLSRAFCDSSKPGRSASSECWVLHSTADYAKNIIAQFGLQKPSSSLLSKVAEELFGEFQKTKLHIPKPLFMRAHRWGSAIPAKAVAEEEKCLWDSSKRLAICGDFCVSPNIEGAILSGIAAALKFTMSSTALGNPSLL